MDKLIMALGPVFAAGFAVQQLLELLTSSFDTIIPQNNKKAILGVVSLVAGFALVGAVPNLRVLLPLGVDAPWADWFVTALVLSAGTEGLNSILKFLKYSKEDKKNTAASKDPSNAPGAAAALGAAAGAAAGAGPGGAAPRPLGIPTADALAKINRQ